MEAGILTHDPRCRVIHHGNHFLAPFLAPFATASAQSNSKALPSGQHRHLKRLVELRCLG